MFKTFRFKQSAKDEKMKIFEVMRNEKDAAKWKELKEQYETYDRMENPGGHISKGDILAAGVSVVSILLVLHFEKLDIITSKAFQWLRPKKS